VTITSEHRFPSAQRLIGLHIRTHAQAKVDQRNKALTSSSILKFESYQAA